MEVINIEEFINNGKDELKDLDLLVLCENGIDIEEYIPFRTNVVINNPREYTDIISEAQSLRKIYITGNNSCDFYKQAIDFISKCDDDIKIIDGGNANG